MQQSDRGTEDLLQPQRESGRKVLSLQRDGALNSALTKFWSSIVRISAATALLACWLDLNFPGAPGVVLYTVFGVVPAVLEFWLACIAFGAYLGAKRALRG